jgi:hypothetical protein
MKPIVLFLSLALLGSYSMYAQAVPSSCTVPAVLEVAYERDIANLSLQAIHEAHSPDSLLTHIPAVWTNMVKEELAAIFNVSGIPERDSVFDILCIHDNTGPYQSYKGYKLQVDTSRAWTNAWQNHITMTGNLSMDRLLTRHHLQIGGFYHILSLSFALLVADSFWNMPPLLDSLDNVSGVLWAEPNSIAGIGGRIIRTTVGNDRLYDFYYQWGDCPAGCINYRVWHFKLSPNCMVEYLGFDTNGPSIAVGMGPNCNITTRIDDPREEGAFTLFPNPTTGKVYLEVEEGIEFPTTAVLYDITGRKLQTTASFTTFAEMNLEHYPPGLYTVTIFHEGQVVAVKRLAVSR